MTAQPADTFRYEDLDAPTRAFVRERAERVHNLARMTAASIVQIGQYLTEVKERLGHGNFRAWTLKEFGWQKTAANSFMQVFENIKCPNFGQLEIDISALYLIAAPSTPEPVRAEVIRRAGQGEPVSHAGARALVQRFVETGKLPEVEITLPRLIAERRAITEDKGPRILAPTPAQRREWERMDHERQENTARVAALMNVVQAINLLARTQFRADVIAAHIERLDTPDQDWTGNVQKALGWLQTLREKLS